MLIDLNLLRGLFKVDYDHKWGYELIFANTNLYAAKLIVLDAPIVKSSIHHHLDKDETFAALYGNVYLEIAGAGVTVLTPGTSFRIAPGVKHSFWTDEQAVILEVSTYDDPKDNVKEELSRKLSYEEKLQFMIDFLGEAEDESI